MVKKFEAHCNAVDFFAFAGSWLKKFEAHYSAVVAYVGRGSSRAYQQHCAINVVTTLMLRIKYS
jgi:hypothetical protein